MSNRIAQKLTAGRKALLTGAGVLAIVGLIANGICAPQLRGQSKQPSAFEVTSVKPYKGGGPIGKGNPNLRAPEFLPGGRFTSTAPLLFLIAAAYDIPMSGPIPRITGGPAWLNSPESVYDIEATAPKGALTDGLSAKDRTDREKSMLQSLLANRFKLVVHREMKETPVYALVVGKGGPKLEKADIEEKDCPVTPDGPPSGDGAVVCHRFNGGRGRGLHARAVNMADLVSFVEGWADRPLLEKTGIKGLYKIETTPWLPMDVTTSPAAPGTKQDGADVSDLPTLFTVFERLGLKLESQKEQMGFIVIDHIEKPTEN